jgi:hypothetical protein
MGDTHGQQKLIQNKPAAALACPLNRRVKFALGCIGKHASQAKPVAAHRSHRSNRSAWTSGSRPNRPPAQITCIKEISSRRAPHRGALAPRSTLDSWRLSAWAAGQTVVGPSRPNRRRPALRSARERPGSAWLGPAAWHLSSSQRGAHRALDSAAGRPNRPNFGALLFLPFFLFSFCSLSR